MENKVVAGGLMSALAMCQLWHWRRNGRERQPVSRVGSVGLSGRGTRAPVLPRCPSGDVRALYPALQAIPTQTDIHNGVGGIHLTGVAVLCGMTPWVRWKPGRRARARARARTRL
jgi:hypothetical protein